MSSVVIIGAGIIGLSIGWQLVREGFSVQILEQREAGKQASWAAAGMLAPYSEASHSNLILTQMSIQSLALYPRFLDELARDTDAVLPPESEGTLCVAINRDDREWLQKKYQFQKEQGMPVQWLSSEEAHHIEPLLSPKVNSAIWISSEKQVNNHRLIEALKQAFLIKGGVIIENTKATRISRKCDHFFTIQTENDQHYAANHVVNAAGAWAQQIGLTSIPNESKLFPQKGQLLNLKMPPHLFLRTMIRSPRIYLAPKQDGSLRVGATSEESGFNENITAGAILEILENAWELIPAISEFKVEDILAGLRPMPANHLPFIGASSEKGFYHAIGHGRSGILLAPYTAYMFKGLFYANSI